MAAKKVTLPFPVKKRALPVLPVKKKAVVPQAPAGARRKPTAGGRTPSAPGSSAAMPAWVNSARKGKAAQRTTRKSGGK